MSRLCRITDAGNTYNYALTLLKNKGYKIFLVPDEREEYLGDFWAIKDKRDFIASDPLRLLALVNIWEELGDEWYTSPTVKIEKLYTQILGTALPEKEDLENMEEFDFQTLIQDYQILFEALDVQILLHPKLARGEFYEILNGFYKENND